MDGQDSLCARSYRPPCGINIHRASVGAYINEFRHSAAVADGPGRRNESHWDREDFVARADTRAKQCQMQGRGARVHGDAVFHTTIFCERAFEFRNMRTQHVVGTIAYVRQSRQNLATQTLELRLEVDKWN